jgi:hypothetical protein
LVTGRYRNRSRPVRPVTAVNQPVTNGKSNPGAPTCDGLNTHKRIEGLPAAGCCRSSHRHADFLNLDGCRYILPGRMQMQPDLVNTAVDRRVGTKKFWRVVCRTKTSTSRSDRRVTASRSLRRYPSCRRGRGRRSELSSRCTKSSQSPLPGAPTVRW